jgi:hypothetical protein
MIKPKLDLSRQGDNDLLTAAVAVKNAMTVITAYAVSLQAAADGKIAQQAYRGCEGCRPVTGNITFDDANQLTGVYINGEWVWIG